MKSVCTHQHWTEIAIQDVTGPVSFLVMLKDVCLLRLHLDHSRHCVTSAERSGDGTPVTVETPEGMLPDMLMEASLALPNPPVTTSPTDTGSPDSVANTAEGNSHLWEVMLCL